MHILVTGGARSGKSLYSEKLYQQDDDVTYVASYVVNQDDQEMLDRVSKHQNQRNSLWQTIEVNTKLDLKDQKILLDCLSIFTSNVMYLYTKDLEFIDHIVFDKMLQHLKTEIDNLFLNNKDVVIVTNEIGCGLVPINHLERVYRDLLGKINQYVASCVDSAYLLVSGLPIQIKGAL